MALARVCSQGLRRPSARLRGEPIVSTKLPGCPRQGESARLLLLPVVQKDYGQPKVDRTLAGLSGVIDSPDEPTSPKVPQSAVDCDVWLGAWHNCCVQV